MREITERMRLTRSRSLRRGVDQEPAPKPENLEDAKGGSESSGWYRIGPEMPRFRHPFWLTGFATRRPISGRFGEVALEPAAALYPLLSIR